MGRNNGNWNNNNNQGNWNNNNNQGNWNNNNNQNRPPKKHSGCKHGTSKNGEYITGWNYSKGLGMISFIASPRVDDKKRQTTNERWENWAVKVQFKDGVKWFNGFYDLDKKRLIIKDLQKVANPSKNYFGAYFRRKN